jgi:hypothetical protein
MPSRRVVAVQSAVVHLPLYSFPSPLSIVLIPAAALRLLVIHRLRFPSGPISVYTRVHCNYSLQNGLPSREAFVNVKAAYYHITRLWQHHDHKYNPIPTKMNINVRPTVLEPQLPHLLDLPLETDNLPSRLPFRAAVLRFPSPKPPTPMPR